MIVTFQDVVQEAIDKVFEAWYDDVDRTLVWGLEPVEAAVRCHGCDHANTTAYDEDGEEIPAHSVVGLRITLALMALGCASVRQGVVFTCTLQQALNGELIDLLRDLRVEFDFAVQTGDLDDTEDRMREIAASYQEKQ